jgi:hypothetical protein
MSSDWPLDKTRKGIIGWDWSRLLFIMCNCRNESLSFCTQLGYTQCNRVRKPRVVVKGWNCGLQSLPFPSR